MQGTYHGEVFTWWHGGFTYCSYELHCFSTSSSLGVSAVYLYCTLSYLFYNSLLISLFSAPSNRPFFTSSTTLWSFVDYKYDALVITGHVVLDCQSTIYQWWKILRSKRSHIGDGLHIHRESEGCNPPTFKTRIPVLAAISKIRLPLESESCMPHSTVESPATTFPPAVLRALSSSLSNFIWKIFIFSFEVK